MLAIVFWGSKAIAGDIEAGTFSVGASSNAAFYMADYDDGHYNELSVDMEIGYFIFKNWEIGANLGLTFGEDNDSSFQSYSLLPYLGYHWALNDKSNIYGRIGGGYGLSYNDFDDGGNHEHKISSLFAEVGYQYFLSKNISLGLGVRGVQSEQESEPDGPYGENSEDTTTETLSTRLKFNLYF
jgi:long-subunit fatty acid transport protein